MPFRRIPLCASFAESGQGALLYAPSASRNVGPLCDLLKDVAPQEGTALELASGTGQHVVAFARALPLLHWQPSDIDPDRRASIDAHAAKAGLSNVSPALDLDATIQGWSAKHQGQSLIVVINLLHLISAQEAATLIDEASNALATGGRLVIYGPFMRAGELTSPGDREFHTALTAQDPEIGYKDDFDTLDMVQATGLETTDVIEMPANNLALIFQKPTP
ncbi:DUF938 domain-containing protein [Pontibaca salina]|uniref:DUF938 domain-containing protein n=1 Tax=Pontibaca salina TaxID=2795731 RepID=A0A934HT26_9RHOB|nr:DUF938 domain-containing protein [Pontibaca salina]MBI6629708.1 DUF938 domain-containing protein [Pontibaca salina]